MNNQKPTFIAEIKTQSMFGFKAKYQRETLIETALRHGDWISVHTDPRFGGSFDDIYYMRRRTNKPILAKGFHTNDDDVKRAFGAGADYVLVVDRMIVHHPKMDRILLELSYDYFNKLKRYADFANSPVFDDAKFVFNGRDLQTGLAKKYIGNYHKYRSQSHWLCGASLIEHPDDVQRFYPNCDAFIVGEHLVEFCKALKSN